MQDENDAEGRETRQEKRGERLSRTRSKIKQHGRGMGRVYKNAILKRVKHDRKT